MYDFYVNKIYLNDLDEAISKIVNIDLLKGKKIIVTGANGLIGSFIVDVLMKLNSSYGFNINIFALVRSSEIAKKRFSSYKNNNLFEIIEHDILTPISLNDNFDYIIHAAANAIPSLFGNDPVGTLLGNIIGTKNILDILKYSKGGRILYISSGEVYGDNGDEIFYENSSYGSINPLETRFCYPLGKCSAENLCVSYYEQFEVNTVISRLCHVYGPNAKLQDNRATAYFFDRAINKRDITMSSDGAQYRSYCYIADAVSGLITVLLNGNVATAYNIANNNSRCTIADFAKEVAKQAGIKIAFEKEKQNDIKQMSPFSHAVLSSEKIENLGWQGSFNLQRGIKHTLKILKAKNDI